MTYSEGRRRRWVFPTLAEPHVFENAKTVDETNRLKIVDLLPYWFNVAEGALIPHFDSIMLHMKPFDSPADGKSSFQVEMSEIQSIIAGTTKRSLVLIDEICRTVKGTCIAGSAIETYDRIRCLGIVRIHSLAWNI
ncbi:hypothetical protein K1719_026375 [Acacia pycnantha]|nr:hypothetical protein K1719_026375 [Acacia pycnantha]